MDRMEGFVREMRATYDRAAALLGITADELTDKCEQAGWGYDELSKGIEHPAFRERFDAVIERAQQRRREQIEQDAQKRVFGILHASGPIEMARVSVQDLSKPLPAKLQELVDSYDPGKDGNRIIAGPTGTWKTFAGVQLLNRLVREYVEWQYLTARRHANRTGSPEWACQQRGGKMFAWSHARDLAMATARHPLGQGEPEVVTHAKDAYLLVIDDLGWEPQGDATIPEVLDARYRKRNPVLITTSLTPAELTGRYSNAVMRRVLEFGGKMISLHKSEGK